MKRIFCWFYSTCLVFAVFFASPAVEAAEPVRVGVYYFDGWSGTPNENGYTHHITERLVTEFSEREPVWGWRADTAEIMETQIDYAADAKLGFFAFCWYPKLEEKARAMNLHNALGLFLKAPNKDRLEFCLLVANHGPFRAGPDNWDTLCEAWIELFREPNHLKINGKPVIIFFSSGELRQSFESPDAVKTALAELRQRAQEAGLPGVTVAGCVWPGQDMNDMELCGFDIFTGYNYPGYGIRGEERERDYDELLAGDKKAWDHIAESTTTRYIPAAMVGWDMRPWEPANEPPKSYYFLGSTPEKTAQGVQNAIDWVNLHPDRTPEERLVLLYAWNENGEGGFLTPTRKDGTAVLDAVKKTIENQK